LGYCTPADVYSYGLPRGALRNPGRPATANAAAGALALDVHGFALNDSVTLRPEAGGQLPAPLVEGVNYFAIPIDESHFQLAATADGSAIALTTDGSRIVVIAPLNFQAAIDRGASLIDDQLPAHVVPLVAPYPLIIVVTNAEIAGGQLLAMSGSESVSLGDIIDAAMTRIKRWGTGVPLRGANTAQQRPAGVAVSSIGGVPPVPHSGPPCDPNGWRRWGGL
jgi:hypothetical protein